MQDILTKNWKILLRKIKSYVNVEVHLCMTAHFNITKIAFFPIKMPIVSWLADFKILMKMASVQKLSMHSWGRRIGSDALPYCIFKSYNN